MKISDNTAQEAFTWLSENAEAGAVARAQRLHLEDFTKVVLAQEVLRLMKDDGMSASAAEKVAQASNAYQNHLLGLKEARKEDERFRWKRDQAHAVIEAWRSWNANQRAYGKFQ